jgi:tRNA(Ile)-lysidine synthase
MLTDDTILQALETSLSNIAIVANTRICVGLSAGVDSTVLLSAAAQYCAAQQIEIMAIHVHHGLSGNADYWAQHAHNMCDVLAHKYAISIPCIVEKVDLGDCSDGIEQSARQARYQVFENHCQPADILLQGHHLDDQIETFFMRAIRGSGLTGLSGIPQQRNLSRSNVCQILRPFLAIEKQQLIDYARAHNLSWVEDESNLDSDMDRNWWRNELLPIIWQRYPKQKPALNRTIANIQHEDDLLRNFIYAKINSDSFLTINDKSSKAIIHSALSRIPCFNLALVERCHQKNIDDNFYDENNKYQKKMASYLRAWLSQYVDVLPSLSQMNTIYTDVIQAGIDAEPNISWGDNLVYRYKNHLFLVTNSRLIIDSQQVQEGEKFWNGENIEYVSGILECCEGESEGAVSLKPGEYKLRFWRNGDVAKPYGRSTRKMKKWFQDYSVPSWARGCWPIIVDAKTNMIAAVPGLFVCQGYQQDDKKKGWICEWKLMDFSCS